MNIQSLLDELRDDADLITRSDHWLEQQRLSKAQQMDMLASELQSILLAQQVKGILQQTNKVAYQTIIRDAEDNPIGLTVKIKPISEAKEELLQATRLTDRANAVAQFSGWDSDGYEIEGIGK